MAKKFPAPTSEAFLDGYLVAALWSSTDESEDPLDDNYSISDISDELMAKAVADCNKFQKENAADLEAAGDDSQNGHDFWLTRNHHGVGFWDRGYDEALGDRLTKASQGFGSFYLFINDNGQVSGERG